MNVNNETTITEQSGAQELMSVVVIGHVDHGKSTVVGRLMADTNSLPEGKLESVKEQCRRNSKPFEYAFLLDALKDEQDQGITIDAARCFFQSALRKYVIIDAPGHVEFIKNMVTGAARAEAGMIVIDAKEGIRENSRRHGYLASLLGIKQIAVLINKMDLVDYDEHVYKDIRREYTEFLGHIGIQPIAFVPISGRDGVNISGPSTETPWYEGDSVLGTMDSFRKDILRTGDPFRLPVQDIYKFTEDGDDRRIIAGRIESGSVSVGDEVLFLPSGKKSHVASVEAFSVPEVASASAGQSTGVTLTEQIYIQRGELMCKIGESQPRTSTQFRVNLFWLGRQPMIQGKRYKMKLAGTRIPVWLREVHTVLDATNLSTDAHREQIERHDVAECTLETLRPVTCDLAAELPRTGRFVVIDNYEIAAGGIILDVESGDQTMVEEHVRLREQAWVRSAITPGLRAATYRQRSALILITGPSGGKQEELAKALEEHLFQQRRQVYFLGISNALQSVESDLIVGGERDEFLRRLGEVAYLFTDAGMILVTTVQDLDDYELGLIETLNSPNDLIVVNVGEDRFTARKPDLQLDYVDEANEETHHKISNLLEEKSYLMEYYL
jgi:bifunctional enzyme CysN/CysC